MSEVIPIALVLPAVLTILVAGLIAWSAVRRARPEDLPRVLEICERMLRRTPPGGRGADTVEGSRAEEEIDAGQETPPAVP